MCAELGVCARGCNVGACGGGGWGCGWPGLFDFSLLFVLLALCLFSRRSRAERVKPQHPVAAPLAASQLPQTERQHATRQQVQVSVLFCAVQISMAPLALELPNTPSVRHCCRPVAEDFGSRVVGIPSSPLPESIQYHTLRTHFSGFVRSASGQCLPPTAYFATQSMKRRDIVLRETSKK